MGSGARTSKACFCLFVSCSDYSQDKGAQRHQPNPKQTNVSVFCTVVDMNCRIGLLFSLTRAARSGSRSAWMSSCEIPTLTLYTKDNCSLCDDAKEVLKKFPNKFELEEVDITSPENKEWFRRYRFDIPVFHFQGKYLMKHRVDSELLEKTLQEYHAAIK